MSLVQADFSCLEEATRMTVNDWLSFGSTTILKSRCSMSWPLLSDLALGQKIHRDVKAIIKAFLLIMLIWVMTDNKTGNR